MPSIAGNRAVKARRLKSGKQRIGQKAASAHAHKEKPARHSGAVARVPEKILHSALVEAQDTIRRDVLILSQVKDGVICADLNGIVTYWNDAAERIWGWSPKEMLGRSVFERLPQGQPREWGMQRFAAVVKGEESFGLRHDYRKDGSRVWLEVRSARMVDAERHTIGLVTIARDVTERILADEKIRLSEAMMAAAQHLAHCGSWELDLTNPDVNANPLRWSDECFRIFGFEPGSLPVTNDLFFSRIPREEHAAISRAVVKAIEERKDYSIEHRVIIPGGTTRHVHEQARVLVDEMTGKPLKMVGTVQDITDRRKAELELRRSEDQFRAAMQHSSIGMALVAPNGHWLKVNQALCAIVGYTAQELLATDFQSITHPDDLDADLDQVRRILAGEISAYQMEKRYIHKDGRFIWILLSVSLVRDDADRPMYFISQIQDITVRKQVLEEMRKAKEAAEAATRAKTEFLAMISHEIRTPLNPILGAVQLLLDHECAPEQRELLQIINNAGEHLLTLLNDILDLAKMEAGADELSLAPARVGDLVQGVLEIKNEDARGRGLELRSELDEKLAYGYMIDEPRVRQILLNLVGNAIKFTPQGSVTVCVECQEAGQERDHVRFSVRDTGIGIKPEHAARIFEPFYQVDSSTSRRYEGAGLGLAICTRLIEMMGGEIGVESRPGEGANFWFTLWLERRRSLAGSGTPWPMPIAGARLRHVLLVEDDERSRQVITSMLERAGWEVSAAETSARSLSLFQPGIYDLVLLNLRLPDMNGGETAALFRKREKAMGASPTPIIAHGHNADVQRAQAAGPVGLDDFLPHPIRQVDLMKMLNRHAPAAPVKKRPRDELPPEGLTCI